MVFCPFASEEMPVKLVDVTDPAATSAVLISDAYLDIFCCLVSVEAEVSEL